MSQRPKVTDSQEESDIQNAYELGVNSYIVKAVDFAQLEDVSNRLGFYWLMINQTPAP